MRVLVCGGRRYMDTAECFGLLDQVHAETPVTLVLHGACSGADMMGERWAYRHRIPSQAFFARWAEEGRRAGPLRNQRMLDEGKPDVVVVLPGGRGTADMVRRAKGAGVPIRELDLTAAPRRKGE